jgi:hypothetical protein
MTRNTGRLYHARMALFVAGAALALNLGPAQAHGDEPVEAHDRPAAARIGRFRALLYSGERIEGTQGVLGAQSLLGRTSSGEDLAIDRTKIRRLDRQSGSHAGRYALIGGGLGLTSALLAWASGAARASADPYNEPVSAGQGLAITAGVTGGCAAIAALIGAGKPDWKPVSLSHVGFNVSPRGHRGVAVAFTLNFGARRQAN